MPPPLVSIAIPVFDTARFLPAALDSLLAQDHAEWEALLWEDGSTDGSAEIATAYAARDPRFRLLGDGRNHGIGVGLARALREARGTYVGVLDGDDLLASDEVDVLVVNPQSEGPVADQLRRSAEFLRRKMAEYWPASQP